MESKPRLHNPNKSPADPEPTGLVAGHDGQRSPLQPSLKEPTHWPDGQLRFESTDNPDGSWTGKEYYPDGQLDFESTTNPDGSWTGKDYYPNGQLEFESTENPDGSGTDKRYYPNGQLRFESTEPPGVSWTNHTTTKPAMPDRQAA